MITQSYTLPSTVMLQIIDDEALLFNSVTGLFFSLNETGAVMWECMMEHQTFPQVVEHLQELFEIDPSLLEHDLYQFISTLKEQELVVISE